MPHSAKPRRSNSEPAGRGRCEGLLSRSDRVECEAFHVEVKMNRQAETVVLLGATHHLAAQDSWLQLRVAGAHGDYRAGADRQVDGSWPSGLAKLSHELG